MKIRLISAFFLFFISVITFAQDISGNVEGRISDATGTPLSRVNITLQSENLQGQKGTATDDKGYFKIFFLPVGNYKVQISFVGYRNILIENVQIRLGKTTYLSEIKLEQETIDLPEITISGEKQTIDPASTVYGGNIQTKDVEQLPVDRDYKSLVSLLPQANTSYYGDGANIGGATGFENKYFVDGVEVTNPVLGTSALNLPYNFVQEIEVKSGGYEAEFRSALGGLINIITHSGSNEFHGTAFGFYTGNRFTNDSKLGLLDPTQGDFSNYDFGIGLGGPVIYDKLWFYAAYNPTVNNRDVEVPGFGIYDDKTVIHSFAGKLSWSASQKLRLFLTATGDPSKWNTVGPDNWTPPTTLLNPDPYFYDIKGGGVNISLNGIYTLGDKIILNAVVSRLMRFSIKEPSTELGKKEFFFIDYGTNTWSGGNEEYWDVTGYSTVFNLNGTMSIESHNLTAGIEYKIKETDFLFENNRISKVNDSTFYNVKSKYLGDVYHYVPSVFLQDSWQLTPSVRINAGIRWDGQHFFSSNGQNVQTVTMPLQPRIGIIFLPDKDGSQKIFTSYGRFSQEIALLLSVNYHSDEGYDYIIRYDNDPRISQSVGDTLRNFIPSIETEVEGLRGQYFDEFSLGYEKLIGLNIRIGIQGLYRTLGEAVDDVWLIDENRYQYGNPGRGTLSAWPKPQRDYTALIISISRTNYKHFNFIASYVLSRDYGNYEGLFDSFLHNGAPNQNWAFDDITTASNNATGLIPNDRTHVFKFAGSYRFLFGLTTGISFIIQSGTPLNDFAQTDYGIKFLIPRGSSGRTPTIWDLNARFTYELPLMNLIRSRLILDLFHIASQRESVDIDQLHYFTVDPDGNPSDPNPTYGQAYRYQQPMSMRLGMEINF